MNSIQVREQIISFLLQQIDMNARVVEELQKKVAELQKEKAEALPKEEPKKAKTKDTPTVQ